MVLYLGMRLPIHQYCTYQLIRASSSVLPDYTPNNIPNIDPNVRAITKMGQSLRLRHPRRCLYDLLALSIRLPRRLEHLRSLLWRLSRQRSLRRIRLLHLVNNPLNHNKNPSWSLQKLTNPLHSLFFCLTSAMSVYGVIYFRSNGTLPGASRIPTSASMIDPDHEAFSTAPHDDEYAPVHMNDKDYSHPSEMDSGEASGSAQPYDPTSYSSSGGMGVGSGLSGAGRVIYAPPTVTDVSTAYRPYGDEHEHGGYDGETGRVRFPAGNYS